MDILDSPQINLLSEKEGALRSFFKNTFLYLFFLVFGVAYIQEAHAQAFDVTLVSNINFGTIEVTAPPGGVLYNSIGTNGTISYASGHSGPGIGTPGKLSISGVAGWNVRVSCNTGLDFKNGGSQKLGSPFYVAVGASNGQPPNTGTQCAGVGNSEVSYNLTGNPATDVVLIGVRKRADGVVTTGSYSLTPTLTVRVRRTTGGGATIDKSTLGGTVEYRTALSITSTTNMDYGSVFFGAVGATDRAHLGTNGGITYAGGFSGAGTGTAGRAVISGATNGTVLEVFCSSTATLTNGAGASIQATGIEVDPTDSTGAIGTGSACNGIAGAAAMSFTYNTATRNSVYVGGSLNGSTAVGLIGGVYSSQNAGGSDILLSVVRQ